MTRAEAIHDLIERVSMMHAPELRSLAASLPPERIKAIEDIAWVLQLGSVHTEALKTNQINIADELEKFAAWKQGPTVTAPRAPGDQVHVEQDKQADDARHQG